MKRADRLNTIGNNLGLASKDLCSAGQDLEFAAKLCRGERRNRILRIRNMLEQMRAAISMALDQVDKDRGGGVF